MYIGQLGIQPNNALSPFVLKGPQEQKKNPVTEVLQQVSSRMTDIYERRADLDAAVKAEEIRQVVEDTEAEAAQAKKMEGLPDELLHFFRNQFVVAANGSRAMEQELLGLRDQLQGFDQVIQEYQAMIEDKAALPEGYTKEDVQLLLTTAQQEREKCLQNGAARVNRWNGGQFTSTERSENYMQPAFERVLGGNPFAGADASDWTIDPGAEDIYGEIDKALRSARSVTSAMEDGLRKVCNELEKRGYTEWKYERHLEGLRQARQLEAEKKSPLELMMERLQQQAEDGELKTDTRTVDSTPGITTI